MSLLSEHETYLKLGGLFELPKAVLRLSGPDGSDFLHRLTTQDVKNLRPGFGFPAALLQADSRLVSFFDIYHCGNFFFLVVDQDLFQTTWDYLEKFHFAEDIKIQNESSEFGFLSVQGPQSGEITKKVLGRIPPSESEVIGTETCFIARRDDFQNPGYHLVVKSGHKESLKTQLKQAGLQTLSLDLWKLLRAESGHFQFGVDINEKNLVLESALAGYISRNKGCYPGQEAVERVFTYGNVSKKLVGVEWLAVSEVAPPRLPIKLLSEGQEVGRVTSLVQFPWNKKCRGFALVRKPHYEVGSKLSYIEDGATQNVTVIGLPNAFEIKRELA